METGEYERYRERKLHERAGFAYDTYLCTIPQDFDRVPPHWHEQMEVIYVKRGSGAVSLNFERLPVVAGSIVVVCPGQIHAIEGDPGVRMEYENIIFSLSALDSAAEEDWCRTNVLVPLRRGTLGIPNPLSPGSELHQEAARALDRADAASSERAAGNSLLVRSAMLLFLHALYVHARRDEPVGPDMAIERLRPVFDEVRLHYDRPLDVAGAARLSGYSKAHFMRIFKQETGQTFVGYLSDYRLSEAESLLRRTNESVTTVARGCGFDNLSYFTRRFRAKYGMPPSAYRKHWMERT